MPAAARSQPDSDNSLDRTFRDPGGYLFQSRGRVLRLVTDPSAVAALEELLPLPAVRTLLEAGKLVATWPVESHDVGPFLETATGSSGGPPGARLFEHERVPFQSFPYEWPAEMLHAAGALTLELSTALLGHDFSLKDATPYNVLFRGPRPVFVDLLSFEKRETGDPVWRAYAQFVRTFLMPLLVNKKFGTGLDQVFLSRRDGLEPGDVYRMSSMGQRLLPPFLGLVSLPTWLSNGDSAEKEGLYKPKRLENPEKARYIFTSLLSSLSRSLARVAPPGGRESTWSTYMSQGHNNYSDAQAEAKRRFVDEALAELKPRAVLDVGCNTGTFSAAAAESGARVVAIDTDPVVVGQTWRLAQGKQLDILPLVVDLARPTPALGWNNREHPSFLERASGQFDLVMMLAVIHHLMVTEGIPLTGLIDAAAHLTRDGALIEFVAPEDSMFRRLCRGREALYAGLDHVAFEAACRRRFDILRVHHQEGSTRWLYLLRRR